VSQPVEAPVRHPRVVAVSTVIVLLVAALAGFAVLSAFQFLGGSLSAAGFGVWLFLALSFVSLLAGLFATFDLVYLLGTGNHLLFRPFQPGSGQAPAWLGWLPLVATVLGIVAGYTIFT
jgi:hypothetical protein